MRLTEEGKAWGWEIERPFLRKMDSHRNTEHKAKQFARLYIMFRKQNSDRKVSWNLTMHHYVFYSSCTKKKKRYKNISQNQCSYLKGKLADKNRTKCSDSQKRTQLPVNYYQRGTMVFLQN